MTNNPAGQTRKLGKSSQAGGSKPQTLPSDIDWILAISTDAKAYGQQFIKQGAK